MSEAIVLHARRFADADVNIQRIRKATRKCLEYDDGGNVCPPDNPIDEMCEHCADRAKSRNEYWRLLKIRQIAKRSLIRAVAKNSALKAAS